MIATDGGSRGAAFVWGFVSPEVASVEIVTARGRHVGAPTTAGARYRGKYAGQQRFFLIETRLPRGDGLFYVRLLDANGRLLAAAEASFPHSNHIGQTRVARGRTAGARWTLRAFRTRALAPLPGEEERVVTRHCVSTVLSFRVHAPYPQASSETCDEPDYPRPVDMAVERTCGPVGLQIAGLADRGVRLLAVFGDGSRRRVALHSLPARFGGRRAFVLLLEPKVALRELVAIEGGHRDVLISGLAPGVIDCPNSSSGFLFGLFASLPRFGEGAPMLQLRDDGVLLCATLGMPDPERGDCGRPPLDAESSWVLTHATDDATLVAGVVPPEVGSAAVVLGNGQSQTVPTSAPGGYSGRYRDLIRTFSLSVPGRQEVRRVVLYGLDGKRLFATRVFTPPTFEIEPTLLKRTPGGWRLGVGEVRFGERNFPCVQLARGDFSLDPFACALGRSRMVRAACSPKRTLLYGWLPGVRAVGVTTTRRRFSQRGLSARRLGIGRLAFVVELGPNEALRSLRFPGRKAQRFRLPPAAQQCGYDEEVTWR